MIVPSVSIWIFITKKGVGFHGLLEPPNSAMAQSGEISAQRLSTGICRRFKTTGSSYVRTLRYHHTNGTKITGVKLWWNCSKMPKPIKSPHQILLSTASKVSLGIGLLLTSSGFDDNTIPIRINTTPMILNSEMLSIIIS